jgi:hypothetical protein
MKRSKTSIKLKLFDISAEQKCRLLEEEMDRNR